MKEQIQQGCSGDEGSGGMKVWGFRRKGCGEGDDGKYFLYLY